ncbi:MAG: helix-turn-helix transcriptional regulator [Ruminococcus sp.]|nr:helix-turn-helix transcriptional regulator [Ruminococcus sp.]
MKFGDKLRHIRTGRKMTQSDVMKAVGISNRTVILYEKGERLPRSESTYKKLSELFEVPVEFWTTEGPDDFRLTSMYAHGEQGKIQAEKLVDEIAGLFAGGKLSEEDADAVMLALQKAYWKVKESKMEERADGQKE